MTNERSGDEPPLETNATASNAAAEQRPPSTPQSTEPIERVYAEPTTTTARPLDEVPLRSTAIVLPEPALSEDEQRYRAMREGVLAPSPPRKPNTTVLLMLGVMSVAWLANTHDSFGSAIALIAALLLNQLGHSFAMRGFGYRDRSLLFIPFYGSIATGTKEDATPTQRALVQLFGPLPGIVLGSVLSFTIASAMPDGHFLRTLVNVLLVLNLFQLLPFPSFTGGELLRLLVLRRNRWVEFAFRGIVGALLVFASLKWSLFVLAAFAGVSLLQLPAQWRIRSAADAIRKRFGVLSPLAHELHEDVLRAIYDHAEVLSARFAESQRPAQRVVIAKEILRLAAEQSPSAAASAGILSVTGALFVLGSIALVLFGRG